MSGKVSLSWCSVTIFCSYERCSSGFSLTLEPTFTFKIAFIIDNATNTSIRKYVNNKRMVLLACVKNIIRATLLLILLYCILMRMFVRTLT